MRRTPCDHDKVYSGHLRHGAYAWICRACGCCGWSNQYDVSRVNLDEYHSVRVIHGWATPRVIPPPPRVPVIPEPRVREPSWWYAGVVLFTLSSLIWLLLGADKQTEWSTAFIGSGSSLLSATLCFVMLGRTRTK